MTTARTDFQFSTLEDFMPESLGKSLCMDFNAVLNSFTGEVERRVNGALSGYIYDVPQFPGDQVDGGIHYAKYVQLPTSLIPRKQPGILKDFSNSIKDIIGSGTSFFDLGPGPEWSIRKNTLPSVEALRPSFYLPVDLEPEFTADACKVIAQEFPDIGIKNLSINFHSDILPRPETESSIIWYPGSTLGNLPSLPGQPFGENKFVREHLTFLRQLAVSKEGQEKHTCYLVLLMDSKKDDIQSMVNLYTSPEAVGCFQSILYKLQRDLKAYDFDPNAFTYAPSWDAVSSAVQHVFTATESQEFTINDCFTGSKATVKIQAGEEYVLANSLKPSRDEMREMIVSSGWEHLKSDTDSDKQFHIHLAKVSSI